MPLGATAAAVGTGLVTRLVGSGVQRLGSLAFQKVMRVAKIDSALKTATNKSPAVQTAINDFETVIGSRYGQLDQQLYDFLREIERSGIVNMMVENALIHRKSKELERIFTDLHKKIMGPEVGAASLLFEKLMKSFSVTLEELCKDKILLGAFRLYRNDLDVRLDRVDLALVELTKTSTKRTVTFDGLRPTFLKIAKGLQGAYRSIRVETNKGARSVDITKIYILPKLRYRDTKSNAEKISSVTRILSSSRKRHSRLEVLDARQEAAQEHFGNITYSDLRLFFSRVVVLGDPGGGKSTLCQHLCHDLAKQAAASLQANSDRLTAQLQKFPIKIILRSYEKARTLEPQLSIYELACSRFRRHRVRCFDGTGGKSWRGGSLHASSSLRLCG